MSGKKIFLSAMVSCCFLFPAAVQADGWDFEAELYLLGTTITGDAGLGRVDGAPVDLDFDAILETLDMAGMVHFEALHESGWGTALDYSFMDLSEDMSGPQGGVAEASVRQGVFQADLFKRMPLGKGSIDYLAGIRWWDNDLEITVDPVSLPGSLTGEVDEDWVDLFVGARLITPINERWNFMLRGDLGGFGLEADFTASLFGNVRYAMTDRWALDIGYKAVWVDYDTGTKGQRGYFAYDTVTHGPLLGVIYKF